MGKTAVKKQARRQKNKRDKGNEKRGYAINIQKQVIPR
jgi:hypothetical protein